ncbi:unnamed protein product [Rhizophagus irregularis]|uniref:Protein kinase domain-containing protein n=1 Tax=Rhizophagus irregularis TaxID=588596 RepID=A0A2N1NKK9_9GLOM|nr:hypothetical protein RhiirC2_774772 [Rhizophagus irregularis]CAB4376471.1 unnamed protein product [Rhizophagus irregularis]
MTAVCLINRLSAAVEIVEIGKGDFGKVSKANLANTGLIVLKSFVDEYSNIEEDELNKFNDEFVKELEILRKIGYHKTSFVL